MSDQYLDCKGLQCPMHVVAVSKGIKKLEDGQTLTVEVTDPSFPQEIRSWAQKTGHEVVEVNDSTSVIRVVIKKRND